MRSILLFSALAIVGGACETPTNSRDGEISPEARSYLDEAVDVMEAHSIRKLVVNWVDLRQRVFAAAGGARTPADTYDAIRLGLRLIGDGHSLFEPPSGLVAAGNSVRAGVIRGELLDERAAYVTVPGIMGAAEHPDAVLFAVRLQELIRELDSSGPCGWIVDLRENSGGSMWPMLAGIGPVLGEGMVGAFVSPEGTSLEWFYRDGEAGVENQAVISVSAYHLGARNPPVAVLTSRATASSGEGVTIAFKGRPQTRSFGSPTAGLSTSNQSFRLSDGAFLHLTTSTMADRAGRLYGGVVEVDEEIENVELAQPAGATVDAAHRWLVGMCP